MITRICSSWVNLINSCYCSNVRSLCNIMIRNLHLLSISITQQQYGSGYVFKISEMLNPGFRDFWSAGGFVLLWAPVLKCLQLHTSVSVAEVINKLHPSHHFDRKPLCVCYLKHYIGSFLTESSSGIIYLCTMQFPETFLTEKVPI